MKKKIIVSAITIGVILIIIAALLLLGVFVHPFAMAELTEVPTFDILEFQWHREQEILTEFAGYHYTIDDPFIVLDPYSMNPLSALIMWNAEDQADVDVVILGDDEFATFRYTHQIVPPRAEVPIIGLYAGRTNVVTLTIDGETWEYEIATEPLPVDFPDYILHMSLPEKMAPGVTLLTAIFESYSPLLDHNAQVRGFFSNKRIGHGTSMIVLENGNMLSTGDEFMMIPYHKSFLIEYNWLGKIFRVYDVSNGVHHSVFEMPNGDILASSNNINMRQTGTREDVAIIIDRQTGAVTRTFDFREIVDETRAPHHHFHPGILNAPITDWMHMNAAVFDPMHNAVITSSPTQSMVISIDAYSAEINWILGPHDHYRQDLQRYLLTPIGDGFEWSWAQHDPRILYSDDPNIINILVFDNGANRSFYEETSLAAVDNYSRAVKYRINLSDMTIEQLWQFGKELGSKYYSTYLGSAVYLGDTVLINFGGKLRQNGVPTDDLMSSVMGITVTSSAIVEVTLDGEIVFEVSVHENDFTMAAGTYMATRIPLFIPESFSTLLGSVRGERVGAPPVSRVAEDITVPPIYFGRISADLSEVHRVGDRLVIEGTLFNDGSTRLLSRAYIILRGSSGAYVFETNSGLNGRFFASVDLTQVPSGQYQIAFVGATVEGNDALGRRTLGHFSTEYRVTVA
ncbi:MAG: aryl-sulfate sulfotransferase [Oscillospiraceae bacterium]|nr:aryl-sulfate sulfotransferase [Oscillospiraceae bacterium]